MFCGPVRPIIGGLEDLLAVVGITAISHRDGTAVATVTGHSTALSGHLVSPINPRLIFVTNGVLVAFQRGVQKVELIAPSQDRPASFNFYLLRFSQACNGRPGGCHWGDLYTPSVERDWVSWTLLDDEDLKNTPEDCRQCHQRRLTEPRLLMRELNSPWTHFFQPLPGNPQERQGPGILGSDLMQDYLAAKGDEPYGAFPMEALMPVGPFLLENLVGGDQPLFFDAPGIESERWPYDLESGYADAPVPSPSWEAAYRAFQRGDQLALPFVAPRATDPGKQARLTAAYSAYRAGELDASELPDLGDIFPDDPAIRARIGLQTDPESDAVGTLIEGCGSCHNDVLDQSISRARFSVNLWSRDETAIARAIDRINLSPDAPGAMPPPEARKLDPGGRARLLAYLADPGLLARPPEPRLRHAAEVGMAGGSGGGSDGFFMSQAPP